MGAMAEGLGFVGSLSRPARRALLEIAARRRTYRELARLLGVSPAAVSKYMSGRMYPSDEVVARLLGVLEGEELAAAARVMLEDLAGGLRELVGWALREGLLSLEDVAVALRGVPCGDHPRASGGGGGPTPLRPQRAMQP